MQLTYVTLLRTESKTMLSTPHVVVVALASNLHNADATSFYKMGHLRLPSCLFNVQCSPCTCLCKSSDGGVGLGRHQSKVHSCRMHTWGVHQVQNSKSVVSKGYLLGCYYFFHEIIIQTVQFNFLDLDIYVQVNFIININLTFIASIMYELVISIFAKFTNANK